MFLAHYVGGGVEEVLNMSESDFYDYLDVALKFYKLEIERTVKVGIAGTVKK